MGSKVPIVKCISKCQLILFNCFNFSSEKLIYPYILKNNVLKLSFLKLIWMLCKSIKLYGNNVHQYQTIFFQCFCPHAHAHMYEDMQPLNTHAQLIYDTTKSGWLLK